MNLFDRILAARGIDGGSDFLSPDYEKLHDPYLMPDMDKAVKRLVEALIRQDKITIYGDYDIDGLSATALIYNAMIDFGYKNLETFIPNRFVDGYGLSETAIKNVAQSGTRLIITVDCGSRSVKEIDLANSLGVDVIVTDHHIALEDQPAAIAVINPKRTDSVYPFSDLAGVGVAFKLVQALQVNINKSSPSTRLKKARSGLPFGQEKWLLDLVALGTICDAVPLLGENRLLAYWGVKVLQKTRRHGLKALMAVSGVEPEKINSKAIGFSLGPRLNASGRLDTAKKSLDLLLSDDNSKALEIARHLDELNSKRRTEQDKIFKQAIEKIDATLDDAVLVVSGRNWNHGIVGIVASKLMEKYHKPTFVIEEMDDKAKGSARSCGDFNLALALDDCRDLLLSGGGHKFAAGVSLDVSKIDDFRKRINQFYKKQNLGSQADYFLPKEDALASLDEMDEALIEKINLLEPFGNSNPQPILMSDALVVDGVRLMGDNGQHIKLRLKNKNNAVMDFVAFSAPEHYYVNVGDELVVWHSLELNEWRGSRSIVGRLLSVVVKTKKI